MTPAKARFAVWSLLRKELHDSLTVCNWVWPLAASPLKSRGYQATVALEAQFYSAVTGRPEGRARSSTWWPSGSSRCTAR